MPERRDRHNKNMDPERAWWKDNKVDEKEKQEIVIEEKNNDEQSSVEKKKARGYNPEPRERVFGVVNDPNHGTDWAGREEE